MSFPQNPTTGIQYLKGDDAGFNIYPNPASNQFALVFDKVIYGDVRIRVLDVTGKEVYSEKSDNLRINNTTIQTSSWESGLYSIIIETKDGIMSRKLMVQN